MKKRRRRRRSGITAGWLISRVSRAGSWVRAFIREAWSRAYLAAV